MGNQKLKWTQKEEETLRAGVAKHGTGKWKNILKDPEFAPFLTHRSNIDLKDKWRNMGINTLLHSSGERSRTPKVRAVTTGPQSNTQSSSAAAVRGEDDATDDPPRSPQDARSAPRYISMIFDALATLNDSNGSDIGAIVGFIEQRHEVPQNFRRLLGSKLRRLVLQGKLEKEGNCYKIKKAEALGTKTPTPRQKDIRRTRPSQNSGLTNPEATEQEAAMAAAYRIADAENKSAVAAEAVKEAERVSKMAEDAESLLLLVEEIYEQCSRGGIVLLA